MWRPPAGPPAAPAEGPRADDPASNLCNGTGTGWKADGIRPPCRSHLARNLGRYLAGELASARPETAIVCGGADAVFAVVPRAACARSSERLEHRPCKPEVAGSSPAGRSPAAGSAGVAEVRCLGRGSPDRRSWSAGRPAQGVVVPPSRRISNRSIRSPFTKNTSSRAVWLPSMRRSIATVARAPSTRGGPVRGRRSFNAKAPSE